MAYEIDQRVLVLRLSWLKGDTLEWGVVTGLVYDNLIEVKLDSDHDESNEYLPQFNTLNGVEAGKMFPRFLIDPDHYDSLLEDLKPGIIERIFRRN